MESLGIVKIQVVNRKDRAKPKVLVNLPYAILEKGYEKGTALTVFVDSNHIILSKDGKVPRAHNEKKEKLLELLVSLFTKAFQDSRINKELLKFEEVEEILSLIGGE